MIKRVRFYFPIHVRVMVPDRYGPGRNAFDCPLWKAPWIWFREWLARRELRAIRQTPIPRDFGSPPGGFLGP